MPDSAISQEEIEGLDDKPIIEDLSTYPLDDVMVRNETRTVSEVVKRIKSGRYAMNPDFQRDFVWPHDKQSKLIESCVMRIPLPVFYVAEGADGRVTVVDGLQRLSTFRNFLDGRLRLSGLGKDHPLEGKLFEEIPVHLQERIEDTQLTLYILDKNAPEAARLDIFERVNSGIPLTRQQMRNALYDGLATRWLSNMSKDPIFKRVTGSSLDQKTMRDREAINRFAAFYLIGWKTYVAGDMDDYLATALKTMNGMGDDELAHLTSVFRSSLLRNESFFGRHAFRKSLVEVKEDAYRSVLNISLFDVFSVAFARIDDQSLDSFRDEIESAVIRLMGSDQFLYCITYSTNSTKQVRGRFMLMERLLGKYFDA